MRKKLHEVSRRLLLLLVAVCVGVASYAADDEPIAVFKTNSYVQNGPDNIVSILFGSLEEGKSLQVDCGNGRQELALEKATVDEAGEWSGSVISCNVSAEGVIKVYGNAEDIYVLNASGCYITQADISRLTGLGVLDLSHNELESLDLSGQEDIYALYLNDNPFGKTPLYIGAPKDNLTILDIGQVGSLDQRFQLSDYPYLMSFDAWSCSTLRTLDTSRNTYLKRLSIDSCPVTSLDLSNNKALLVLNISETGVTDLDLSNNTQLTQLYCDRQSTSLGWVKKLKTLDVSGLDNLMYLFASGNELTSIDVSKNINLTDLYLSNNRLTSIDVSKNDILLNLVVRNNCMDFATLPLPKTSWLNYDYIQSNMPVAKSFKVGAELDLSERVLRDDWYTGCALFMTSDKDPGMLERLGDEYFTYKDGKVTFLKATPDSVYLAFECDAFPAISIDGLPLRTDKFMVKSADNYGKPDLAFTLTMDGNADLALRVGMHGASVKTPKTFFADYGDGVLVKYIAMSSGLPKALNMSRAGVEGEVKVYVPENEKVSSLAIDGVALAAVDLTPLHEMIELRITDAGLANIDLGWNRMLSRLTLNGNNFGTLNIRGANDAFQKTLLTTIDLSGNALTEVTLNDNYTIHHLNLSNNALTELSFKDADMMETVDLSHNRLESLDFNYCTQLTSLNVSDNCLTSLVVPDAAPLQSMDIHNNNFTFASLPMRDDVADFVYAPQNTVGIAKVGPGADLRKYLFEDNTTYVWHDAGSSATLSEGVDYTVSDGYTRFLDPVIGQQLYCEMTNSAFPQLVYTTSAIQAAEMPTHVLATFDTPAACKGALRMRAYDENTIVCIDWKGTGLEFEQYVVGPQLEVFSVESHEGATARVLAYSDNPGVYVFSCDSIAMSSFDASAFEGLYNLTVKNAGLESITLPDDKNSLVELNLDNNDFSAIDVSAYPKIIYLMLNNNKFTSFDASPYKSLQLLGLGANKLTSVTLDNPELWSLDLGNNRLESVDLSKVPSLYQFACSNNRLSSIDLSAVPGLRALLIDRNRFRISTLPVLKDMALYTYSEQAPVQVECVGGRVDLSSEALVGTTQTIYRWFVDEPTYDENTGELVGNELVVGKDFVVNDGVTSFCKPVDGVICVMNNEELPDLDLYTNFLDIEEADPDGIVLATDDGMPVETRVYAANGTLVRTVMAADGAAAVKGLAPGIYVIRAGDKAFKTVVR